MFTNVHRCLQVFTGVQCSQVLRERSHMTSAGEGVSKC